MLIVSGKITYVMVVKGILYDILNLKRKYFNINTCFIKMEVQKISV